MDWSTMSLPPMISSIGIGTPKGKDEGSVQPNRGQEGGTISFSKFVAIFASGVHLFSSHVYGSVTLIYQLLLKIINYSFVCISQCLEYMLQL